MPSLGEDEDEEEEEEEGDAVTELVSTTTKGTVGSDDYEQRVKNNHPEIYGQQPLVKWMPLCPVSMHRARWRAYAWCMM